MRDTPAGDGTLSTSIQTASNMVVSCNFFSAFTRCSIICIRGPGGPDASNICSLYVLVSFIPAIAYRWFRQFDDTSSNNMRNDNQFPVQKYKCAECSWLCTIIFGKSHKFDHNFYELSLKDLVGSDIVGKDCLGDSPDAEGRQLHKPPPHME